MTAPALARPTYLAPTLLADPTIRSRVYETIARAPIDWPRLATPAGMFQAPGWLAFCEELAQGPTRLVTAIGPDGTLLGALPLFLIRRDHAGLYDPAVALGPIGRDLAPTNVLVLGAPSGYRAGFGLTSEAAQCATEVAATLLRAADDVATQLGADALSMQYLPSAQARILVETGAFAAEELVVQDYEVSIELKGSGFDAYLDALSSRRRATVRRDIRAFERAELGIERMRLSSTLDFAPRLFARLKDHHAQRLGEAEARDWFARQATRLDEHSLVCVARDQHARVIAYSLSYVWEKTLYVRTVGMDHDGVQESGAYFMVTYYEPLRVAYERGLQSVHLGIKALRPKVMRGGVTSALYAAFRGRGSRRISAESVNEASRRNTAVVEEELGPLLSARLDADHLGHDR